MPWPADAVAAAVVVPGARALYVCVRRHQKATVAAAAATVVLVVMVSAVLQWKTDCRTAKGAAVVHAAEDWDVEILHSVGLQSGAVDGVDVEAWVVALFVLETVDVVGLGVRDEGSPRGLEIDRLAVVGGEIAATEAGRR